MATDKKRTLCFTRDRVYGADGRFMEPLMICALEAMKVRSLEFFFFCLSVHFFSSSYLRTIQENKHILVQSVLETLIAFEFGMIVCSVSE